MSELHEERMRPNATLAVLSVSGLAYSILSSAVVPALPTIGGALGGQLAATFIAGHMHLGLPSSARFTDTFLMATGFLVVCALAALLVPGRRRAALQPRVS